MTQLSSYLTHTGDFINVLTTVDLQEASSELFLVTVDVVSLHTNTPYGEGLEALRHFLDLRPSLVPLTQFLVSGANLAPARNYFLFNEQFYLQSQGVSMGSFGHDYANLFM